ncbi:histidine phosphatase family protein [Bradyrhizobium diazoefficiens]|nr:histidine phosphatase family protein [Bradyrhizobium diazoefficiens]UCF54988.1 MAG: histidine phosphatase family protein [Bradyrhizobium sp.]MBR0968396.1 histidine phosphatase family protein [Bradyrhizobium diazoefficiens]MBR0981742.1 histidine phosphatase family protein [Bradyrhizobium diazoefficiens]MBR1011173.1 histidine phosphatase family protein [Bradyrhizobium diazoefficiens]MBR1017695.1 histidine phosphatase family protein [Bradyrhizobium diazoefficiens]
MSVPVPSRSFYGLRHGATDWNRQGLFQGRTDNPLNEEGLAQAHAAAGMLREIGISRIVASPLVRAARTAEIIADAIAVPLTIDERIIEFDFGSLEGLPVRDVMIKHGVKSATGLVSILPADGESWDAMSERSLACVSAWLDRHPQDDVLFVCHDAVMQGMANALCGSYFKNSHGIPFRYLRDGAQWRVEQAAT